MLVPDPAKTRDVLLKRIRRLLRIDRGPEDRSELTLKIIPFLSSLGSVALIGGAIRDVARAGRQGFSSDLDFVVYDCNRDKFAAQMDCHRGIKNKFGGYGLRGFRWKVDVWHLEDTWAKTEGLVDVRAPIDLLRCTFFDWDSAVYEIHTRKLVLPEDYLERLRSKVMDIRLEENPNPRGSLVRALRRAARWQVRFGPRLTAFSRKYLREIPWEDLASLDARAFSDPVLKYLDKNRILQQLNSPTDSSAGEVTLPVPEWASQMKLPLGNEPTSLNPLVEATSG